jgi:alkanesulfonate monooxygenase SsuD/methylene tetrahydromethanopterin reductase-like flavin-dependent oxidoreductase (luciferase family)
VKVRFAVSIGLGSPEPGPLAEAAAAVEARGFDTLWMADLPSLPSTEPGLGLAFFAAATRRMRLGANFIPFGVEPYLLAHRLAQLDRLCGGRLLVTLVPGLDLAGERAALGTAGRHRGRLMEELVPQLRRLWSGEALDDGVGLPVLPVQEPLEVWLGGSGPDAIARAGRVADGWLGALVSPSRAGHIRRAIAQEAARAGREIDPEHFGLSIGYARTREDLERAVRVRAPRRLHEDVDPGELVPVGAAALRTLVGRLVDEGLSKFVVRPLAPAASIETWGHELDWLADTVLDLQT